MKSSDHHVLLCLQGSNVNHPKGYLIDDVQNWEKDDVAMSNAVKCDVIEK